MKSVLENLEVIRLPIFVDFVIFSLERLQKLRNSEPLNLADFETKDRLAKFDFT